MDLAKVLAYNKEVIISIEGHTDSDGGDSANKTLSENRANAVKDFLHDNGISSERMQAIGYGEQHPIETNTTSRGKAINRRVELLILDF